MMATGSVPPPSSPSLANLDNKLDQVIQLQLNAQTRLSNLEKVLALHEVALKELGPINHSLAELSQRVDDVDLRLHQAEQHIASSSSTSVTTRPSSLPPPSLPHRASLQTQGRPTSVPRIPSYVRVAASAAPRPHAAVATAIDNEEITRKRRSTLVISGFKDALPRDELVQWVCGQQLGSPTAVYTKMRFSRVVFLVYPDPESARAQVLTLRMRDPQLAHHGQKLYVDMDQDADARRRRWVLRELKRSLSTTHSPEPITIDYGPSIVYIQREVGFNVRDHQIHVGKHFSTSMEMAKIAETFSAKLCL